MRTLYHWPLDPASRQARIALSETKVSFSLEPVDPWNPDPAFLGRVRESIPPALVEQTPSGGEAVVAGARAICEYAHDGTKRHPLLSSDALERAEARRLCDWFDIRFATDVGEAILGEKVERHMLGAGSPDPQVLREGRARLRDHLDYLEGLLSERDWLAGKRFSLADIAGAAHLSTLDFLGEIRWREREVLKGWYQRMKSRPSVQPLLEDRVRGVYPPRYYADVDF